MGSLTKKHIKDNYHLIGPLELEDYVAIESVNKQVFNVRLETIQLIDQFGYPTNITPEQIKEGDTIRISTQIQSVLGGDVKHGNLTIKDIECADYNKQTGELILQSKDYCFIENIRPENSIQAINTILENPNVFNLTKRDISELFPQGTTWKIIKEVKQELEHQQEHGFEKSNREERSFYDFERSQDDLLF